MLAAMFNRILLVTLLLGHGTDLHAHDVNGLSVMDAARLMGAGATVSHLETLLQTANLQAAKH